MALTEAELNALYIELGVDAVWSLRGNLNESLGLHADANGTAGAGIAYTTAGPESCRSGNVATFSGASNSFANMGSLAGLASRVAAGGGFVVHFFFKIASGVTSWKVGTDIPTTGPSLWYARGGSNNQASFTRNSAASNYIDLDVTFGNTLRDNAWHALGLVYNHITGVIRTYIDGELWSEGSTLSSRGTAGDALTTNIANFMLGGYSFNGGGTSAADPFASAFAEMSVASRVFSDEEMLKLYELGVATFMPASWLPLRNGPRAEQVASMVTTDIRKGRPLLVALGDSMLTLNGSGGLADPYMRRRIDAISEHRLANWEAIRIGDAADANAPPGRLVAIAAGSTQKYVVGLRTEDLPNNDYTVGSDFFNRKAYSIDATTGLKVLVGFRKESGGRGPIDYVLRGSDIRPGSSPGAMDGSENYQQIIGTGTAFSAEELTGTDNSVAYTYIDIPAAARYKYLQIELTNTGASTANLVDIDWVSRTNADDGVWFKIAARGGYNISSFFGNHANWPKMYQALRSHLGNPPIHFIALLGANDGSTLTPSAWKTAFASFVTSLFAAFPDCTLTLCTTPPVGGVNGNGNGIIHNSRAANMIGAALEYCQDNPGLAINLVNSRMEAIRAGWTPWTQCVSRYNVIGAYAAATTYAQTNVAYIATNDADTSRRYFFSRFGSQTGVPVLNVDKWTEICRFINAHPSDSIHHSEIGQMAMVNFALSGITNVEQGAVFNNDVFAFNVFGRAA